MLFKVVFDLFRGEGVKFCPFSSNVFNFRLPTFLSSLSCIVMGYIVGIESVAKLCFFPVLRYHTTASNFLLNIEARSTVFQVSIIELETLNR